MASPALILDAGLPVRAFFTTRAGGVSASPFDSLNLSRGGDDAAEVVAENRRRVEDLAGCAVGYMTQVHAATTAVMVSPGQEPEADAIVTITPGLALGVLVADCVPILLHDDGSGAVAAIHAGRAGVAGGVVAAGVARLREVAGAREGTLHASIGPAICGGCYEVPASMRDEVTRTEPAARSETTWGTPALDLRAAVRAQLVAAGVTSIVTVGGCTREDPTLFSHRRDGVTGRFAGIVRCEISETQGAPLGSPGVSFRVSTHAPAYRGVTEVKHETNRERP